MSAERAALLRYLQAQRDSVVAVVDGLDEDLAATVVVPSGWSPLDLVDHLRGAERHWFVGVVAGDLSRQVGDPFADAVSGPPHRTLRDVVEAYEEQWAVSDRIVAGRDLDMAPLGTVSDDLAGDVPDLRGVLLHLIEETARHAGHLDIARELIDGQVGLGPR
jgi:Protein of unknown function (DUF664)